MAYKFNPFTGNFDQVVDKAVEVKYDNSVTHLTADNTQAAIDEVLDLVQNLPTPMQYLGTWDASTNTPTLLNTDTDVLGHVYYVNVGGTVNFGAGNITFQAGDRVVSDGTVWQKWDAVDAVTSVNGATGDVTLDSDDIAQGTTNLYFTDALAQGAITGGASSIVTSNLTSNRALTSDGSGKVAASSVTDTELGYVSGVTSAIQTQLNGKQATITGAATTITSADLTVSRAVVSDALGKIAISATTSTEIGYLSGVTSAIQTQLNAKQATITGAATTITSSDLTASRAVVSDASGKVAVSATTSTEIGYVSGVTSAIQTQLNGKQATITGAATTITSSDLTASRAVVSDASGKVAVSSVTSTELGYVSGVTSSIQTQINSKFGFSTVTVSGTTHTATNQTVVICKHSAPLAITLPSPTANNCVMIKDASNAAETNNITITSPSGNIDGAASLVINSNYGATMLYADGTDWWQV